MCTKLSFLSQRFLIFGCNKWSRCKAVCVADAEVASARQEPGARGAAQQLVAGLCGASQHMLDNVDQLDVSPTYTLLTPLYSNPSIQYYCHSNNSDEVKITEFLIYVVLPNIHTVQPIITGKLTKYQDLAIELKQQWRAVHTSTGIIPNSLQHRLDIVEILQHSLHLLQESVLLNTCRLT